MKQEFLNGTLTQRSLMKGKAFILEYRYAFLGALVCGLLAYMYAFTNNLVNLDGLYYLFGKGATLESGRWGLVLLSSVFPDYAMPWVYGMLSLLLISWGIALCIHIFRIHNKPLQFFVAGLMVTFPSMAATMTYTFTISSYAVAFLLAIIPVYLVAFRERTIKNTLFAVVSIVLCVSIYQAYIAITASLLLLVLIQRVLWEKETEKQLFLTGLGYVVILAAGLGTYWLTAKLLWALPGVEIGSYADSALDMNQMNILRNIKNAYASTFRIFWSGFYGLIATPASRMAHLCCGALIAVEAILWMKRTNKMRIIFLLFLGALLPLSMNCMFLFVNDIMIHSLVMYGFTAVYLLAAILLENGQHLHPSQKCWSTLRKWGHELIIWAMAIIIAGNIWFANKGYLNLHLQYESTQSFAVTVIGALQNTPGFERDSKVAIIGKHQRPQSMDDAFSYLEGIYGLEGIDPNTYSIASLFEYYNGMKLNFASGEEIAAVCATEEFTEMTAFPGYGSVREIQGIFVIKLS